MPALPAFNILIVAQDGRLSYEAALFAASLRHFDPGFAGRLIVAEPQPGQRWDTDPRIADDGVRTVLDRLQAEVVPLENRHFGQSYPNGNKIEALRLLPEGQPFVFFDSDTLITGALSEIPFDFARPSASLNVEGTWPQPQLYGPGQTAIWRALYDRFGLDFQASLDLGQPDEHWRRYLYFNAGWFFYSCPRVFGALMTEYALSVLDDPLPELIGQSLDPWLDQIVLPLVVHKLGGGRGGVPDGTLDGAHSCHYRTLPLAYARASDRVIAALEEVARPNWLKKVLKAHAPMRRMIYQGKGHKVRALFDRDDLPRREAAIRKKIKAASLWMR